MKKQVYSGFLRTIYYAFAIIVLVLSVHSTLRPSYSEGLTILQLDGLDPSKMVSIESSVKTSGISYQVFEESQIDNINKQKVLLLPLNNRLSTSTFQKLSKFIDAGLQVIAISPTEVPSEQVTKLLKKLGFFINGSTYTSNSLPLEGLNPQEILPIQSHLLVLSSAPETRIITMWGKTYPAVIKSSQGVLLNWAWGQVLSRKTNVSALKVALNKNISEDMHPKIAAEVKDTELPKIEPPPKEEATEPEESKDSVDGDPIDPLLDDTLMGEKEHAEPTSTLPPISTSNQYHQRFEPLDQYRRWVEDAVDVALKLKLPIAIKKAQKLLIQADLHRIKSEAALQRGEYFKSDYGYEKAYELMHEALLLTTLSSKIEGRAIWLDRGSIVDSKNPAGLRRLFRKLHNAGINVIYFETLNAGYPIYPSEIVGQNPLTEDWDPLKVAVEEAHKHNMELHAWVWCFAVGNTKHNPLVSKPPQYPGPILEDAGLMSEALRTSWGGIMPPRQTEYWLSPASPKARAFLKSIYKEIITHYDVDGLHLDYIRYPFQRFSDQVGYEDVSRQRYYQDTGQPVGRKGDYPLKAFVAWKTLQVNSFVKELSNEMREIKPNLKLSAAVFPMKRAQRILAIQQDWETWIQKGWIDTLSPMIYTSSRSLFQSTVSRILNTTDKKTIVYPGVAIFRLDPDEMLGHLDSIRKKGGMGSTLFAFAHLDDSKQEVLRNGPYKERHAIPPHQNPAKAMNIVVKRYQKHFNKLNQKGEVMTLSKSEIQSFQDILSQLDSLTSQLATQSAENHMDPHTLTAVRKATETLDENTRQWVKIEIQDRPFQAQLFSEFMVRINQLLEYAEKRSLVEAKACC